jgi:hypothetical protein
MDEFDIWGALETKYSKPDWALMFEVRNCTGWAKGKIRSADAIAMGLWPSRGLELHGIEVKKSRPDWLRELKDPEKAEGGLFPYCDRWWIAISDPKIVLNAELPKPWGLLAPKGDQLVARVPAPALEPKAMDRTMLASILKKALEWAGEDDAVKQVVAKAVREAEVRAKESQAWELRDAKNRLEELRGRIGKFENAAGIRISEWNCEGNGEKFRKFVDVVSQTEAGQQVWMLGNTLEALLRKVREAQKALKYDVGDGGEGK